MGPPVVMALCLATLIAVHGCPILTAEHLQLKKEFPDSDTWIAEVALSDWHVGVAMTIIFTEDDTFHDVHITQAAFASIERDTHPVSVVKLLEHPHATSYKFIVEGTGGCWGAAGTAASGVTATECRAPLVTCDMAPLPDPPPSAPPMPPPLPVAPTNVAELRITKACGDAVTLEWDPPEYATSADAASYPVEYMVNAMQEGQLQPKVVNTNEPHTIMKGLTPGTSYNFAVSARRTGHSDAWHMSHWVRLKMPSFSIDARSLAVTPSASTESCDSLELKLPSLPADPWNCYPSDFLSVEWRVARASERWEPVLDRVDKGDLPNDLLVVDQLDPYETFEFRVLHHHLAPGGDAGEVIAGPGTGALLVGMLRDELLNPLTVSASSSASVDIVLPEVSRCRQDMQQLIWYASGEDGSDGDDDWQLLDDASLFRDGRHVHAHTFRCPEGCRFRWSTDDVKGWDDASAISPMVSTPELPDPEPAQQRLELKLGARSAEARTSPSEWRQRFGEDLSTALGLDSSSIDVVEVRSDGEYVTFDVPRPVPTLSPADSLVQLMKQPACTMGNLALSQPGRCSSSCGNGTSPAFVNDGDLRQYAPHVWQACESDKEPWWSVQLPRTMNRIFVRVLVGDCCSQSFGRTIDVHLASDSGPTSKCAALVVNDGGAVGVYCEGEGDWVTVAAPGAFSLAEIEVCDGADVNSLLLGELTSAVDTSEGLLELRNDGAEILQLAPTLLSTVAPGRDASWRLPPGVHGSSRSTLKLQAAILPLLGGALLLLLVAYLLRRLCSSPSFARVSRSDRPNSPIGFEVESIFEVDDEVDESPRFVGKGSMPVTFERSDGTKISASVNLSGVSNMEQIFSAVKSAATKALGGTPIDHLSLQYMNESRQFEEAWYDPILREGSDLRSVTRARQWRVLVLGSSNGRPAPTYRSSLVAEEEGLMSTTL